TEFRLFPALVPPTRTVLRSYSRAVSPCYHTGTDRDHLPRQQPFFSLPDKRSGASSRAGWANAAYRTLLMSSWIVFLLVKKSAAPRNLRTSERFAENSSLS